MKNLSANDRGGSVDFGQHGEFADFALVAVPVFGGDRLVKGPVAGLESLPGRRNAPGEFGKGNLAVRFAVRTLGDSIATPVVRQQFLLLRWSEIADHHRFVAVRVLQQAFAFVAEKVVVGRQSPERRKGGVGVWTERLSSRRDLVARVVVHIVRTCFFFRGHYMVCMV